MKLLAKIALFFMLAGMVLAVTGLALGADTHIYWDRGFHIGEHTGRNVDFSFAEEFEDVQVRLNLANLTVERGDIFRLHGHHNNTALLIDESGGTLRITSQGRRGVGGINIGFIGTSQEGHLTLTIPHGVSLADLDITLNAGNINIRDIEAQQAHLTSDLGNINATRVHFSDTRIESSVGNVDISGMLLGDARVASDLGNVAVTLENSENEVSWSASAGLGRVSHNGQNRGGGTSGHSVNPSLTLDMSSGVGNVDVRFR